MAISSPQFDLTRHDVGAVAVLAAHGELDIAHSPSLAVAIDQILRAGMKCLVIDLCDVSFVDSTGLAVLLNALRRTARRGAQMKLACDVPSTLKLLSLTRLDRDFDTYPNREAALSAFDVTACDVAR